MRVGRGGATLFLPLGGESGTEMRRPFVIPSEI
jgi:hypothetical protein